MTWSFDPSVLLVALIALVVGFVLGRMSRKDRGDPSDLGRRRVQSQPPSGTQGVRQHLRKSLGAGSPLSARAHDVFGRATSPARPVPAPVEPPVQPLPDLPPEAVRHLHNGEVIRAIKALKDAHPSLSLKQAKDAVDAYAERHGLR